LPPRDFPTEQPNRAHARELIEKTIVVLVGGGQPNPIIGRVGRLVAKYQYDLFANVNRKAAKHGIRSWFQLGQSIEDELMGDRLARLERKLRIVKQAFLLALRHTS